MVGLGTVYYIGEELPAQDVLAIYEKLTMAETLAGITCRAAVALNLNDRGILKKENIADIAAFPTGDYREILYRQGIMKPLKIWKNGKSVKV